MAAEPGSASPTCGLLHPRQRAWVEVDGAAIARNARRLKALLAQGCELMAVVKADGYGHGALPVAQAALAGGPTASVWPPSRREWNCARRGSRPPCW